MNAPLSGSALIEQYARKISTRSSDAGVKDGEKVLEACQNRPWWHREKARG
jgi:hypothetical protein